MFTKLISTTILLTGMTLTIGEVAVKAPDLLASASSAVAYANMSQFRTALDLYYIDHGSYPMVSGATGMFDLLKQEDYIRENAPVNTNAFKYQVENNGQNYSLKVIPH